MQPFPWQETSQAFLCICVTQERKHTHILSLSPPLTHTHTHTHTHTQQIWDNRNLESVKKCHKPFTVLVTMAVSSLVHYTNNSKVSWWWKWWPHTALVCRHIHLVHVEHKGEGFVAKVDAGIYVWTGSRDAQHLDTETDWLVTSLCKCLCLDCLLTNTVLFTWHTDRQIGNKFMQVPVFVLSPHKYSAVHMTHRLVTSLCKGLC